MTELDRKQSTCVSGKKKNPVNKKCDQLETMQSGWLENICSQRTRERHRKKRNEEGRRQLCKPQAALHVLPSLHSPTDAYLAVTECNKQIRSAWHRNLLHFSNSARLLGNRHGLQARKENQSPRLTFWCLLAALNKRWWQEEKRTILFTCKCQKTVFCFFLRSGMCL